MRAEKVLVVIALVAVVAFGVYLFAFGEKVEPGNNTGSVKPVEPSVKPSLPSSVKPVAVCGNGVVEVGEDCESCPKDLGDTCVACHNYKEGKIKAGLGEEFYLCRGQNADFLGNRIELMTNGTQPTLNLAGFRCFFFSVLIHKR